MLMLMRQGKGGVRTKTRAPESKALENVKCSVVRTRTEDEVKDEDRANAALEEERQECIRDS